MAFVIHKTSRTPSKTSYDGVTWDEAGIRHLRQDAYGEKRQAETIATMLAAYNSVGFSVSETQER